MWEGVFLAAVVCAVMVYMSGWYFVSLLVKRIDVVDIAWGTGFILIAFLTAYMRGGVSIQGGLITLLTFFWGLRISRHLLKRVTTRSEDFRYVAMKKGFGKLFYLASLFEVFLFQGVIMVLVALPIILTNTSLENRITPWLAFGVGLWILGFFFETVADFEKDQFVSNPKNKGKILKTGLWELSRHPNYFGEICMWWGIYFIALPTIYWPILLISPLLITFLITRVSGVPLVEGKYKGNKEYQAYKRKTNMLIPFSFKR